MKAQRWLIATLLVAGMAMLSTSCAKGSSTEALNDVDATQQQGGIDAGPRIDSLNETPPSCGNFTCEPNMGEDCDNCADDCGTCCGNGVCEAARSESCSSCSADCGDCCGNGTCESGLGESCSSCAADCGNCCGNGSCDNGETCNTCTADCGTPCSDKNGSFCTTNTCCDKNNVCTCCR